MKTILLTIALLALASVSQAQVVQYQVAAVVETPVIQYQIHTVTTSSVDCPGGVCRVPARTVKKPVTAVFGVCGVAGYGPSKASQTRFRLLPWRR